MMCGEESPGEKCWLGIDFSGNCRMWRTQTKKSNVWVAKVSGKPDGPVLKSLKIVHELPGEGTPFLRLTNLLKSRHFAAAAIDAPFSVPGACVPRDEHKRLLELVAEIQRPKHCPFPAAQDFVCRVLAGRALKGKKPLRETERYWQKQGVNVRSTLWAGPRGGAAMTSACLTLLHETGCAIWPWAETIANGLLVEAFPAAQLRHWKIQHDGYNGNDYKASSTRRELVQFVSARITLDDPFREKLEASADALDAVLCAFAAIAVTTGKLPDWLSGPLDSEGRIAVHE